MYIGFLDYINVNIVIYIVIGVLSVILFGASYLIKSKDSKLYSWVNVIFLASLVYLLLFPLDFFTNNARKEQALESALKSELHMKFDQIDTDNIMKAYKSESSQYFKVKPKVNGKIVENAFFKIENKNIEIYKKYNGDYLQLTVTDK